MKYQELENNKFIVEFDSEDDKENFMRYFTETATVSSKRVEQMGIIFIDEIDKIAGKDSLYSG